MFEGNYQGYIDDPSLRKGRRRERYCHLDWRGMCYQIGNIHDGDDAMRIISKRRLREFWIRHPDAERPLSDWHKVVEHAEWRTPADVKRTFGKASFVGDVVVFNIGGNKYRLTVNVRYEFHAVYVRRVMTHDEYDDGDL